MIIGLWTKRGVFAINTLLFIPRLSPKKDIYFSSINSPLTNPVVSSTVKVVPDKLETVAVVLEVPPVIVSPVVYVLLKC